MHRGYYILDGRVENSMTLLSYVILYVESLLGSQHGYAYVVDLILSHSPPIYPLFFILATHIKGYSQCLVTDMSMVHDSIRNP